MLLHHAAPDFDAATRWLIEQLRAERLGAFARPVVLASHRAQWRKLSLAIADAEGCFGSLRVLTPEAWVDEAIGLEGASREWRPRPMAWRLTELVREQVATLPQSAKLIVDSADETALLEFAQDVAQRFRAYLYYRPELLLSWESGDTPASDDAPNEAWQRGLWRGLVARTGTVSPAQRVRAVRGGELSLADDVPAVIYALTDARVAPVVAEMLERVALQRDLRWCHLDWTTGAERAPAGSLLRAVQGAFVGKPSAANDDSSVTLHACHSPLREVETLYEQAAQALAQDSDLRPHDITLYVSDVAVYAPAVEAVFDVPQPGLPSIPYAIAGRPYRDGSPIVRTVLQLLDAVDGRATLDKIGGLLRLTPIARAAELTDDEATTALSLATAAGITWGVSADDRAERYALPEIGAGTWQHGVDRLVLGVATGPLDTTVDELLPVSGESAGHTMLIGKLASWSERLFATFVELRKPHRAAEWASLMERTLKEFIHGSGNEDAEALRRVRETIREQLRTAAEVAPNNTLPLDSLRRILQSALEDHSRSAGHLSGGMRVCRLEPGTVLPSRVVLMAGFDDALHPGGGGSLGWDLLKSSPRTIEGEEFVKAARQTDPDRRADALAAFREAVCSASHRLHLTWTAFTMTKHDERAPSVSVAELLDNSKRCLTAAAHKDFVRREPAHPFSPVLFTEGARSRSAAKTWAKAATRIVKADAAPQRFGTLPVSGEASTTIPLDVLAACINDPTRHFCGRVLGLGLYDEDDALATSEPQGIIPLKQIGVANDFRPVAWRLEAAQVRGDVRSEAETAEWLRHQPELAYGEEGRSVAAELARVWWGQLAELRSITWLPALPVELRIGRYTIVGRLDHLTASTRVIPSLYAVKEHTALKQWVPHLVANVLAQRGAPLPTRTEIRGEGAWELAPVENAAETLEVLCDFYMDASRQPEPVFRKAGIALLQGLKGADPLAEAPDADARPSAFHEAANTWAGSPYGKAEFKPEGQQEWHRLCWPDADFSHESEFGQRFALASLRVLQPYLSACSTSGGG